MAVYCSGSETNEAIPKLLGNPHNGEFITDKAESVFTGVRSSASGCYSSGLAIVRGTLPPTTVPADGPSIGLIAVLAFAFSDCHSGPCITTNS